MKNHRTVTAPQRINHQIQNGMNARNFYARTIIWQQHLRYSPKPLREILTSRWAQKLDYQQYPVNCLPHLLTKVSTESKRRYQNHPRFNLDWNLRRKPLKHGSKNAIANPDINQDERTLPGTTGDSVQLVSNAEQLTATTRTFMIP